MQQWLTLTTSQAAGDNRYGFFFKTFFMYIIREIFHLKFGHYRQAKELFEEAIAKNRLLLPEGYRVLTDFTGKSYRLILELPFATLADYEAALKKELEGEGWPDWYRRFRQHVASGEREILKQVK